MKQIHIFDLDGTLIDSMPFFARGVLQVLEEEGIPYGDDLIDILTPLGDEKTALLYQEMGVPGTVEKIIHRMQQNQYPDYAHSIPLKPGIEGYLRHLKAQGRTLCVLTASPHITLDACLNRLGIFDLFDNVWSCDDFNTTKADPEIYKRAAERIGEPVEQVLFLDDNLHADTTAKAAGMQVCGVYDPSSDDYVDAMKAATDYYIYDFSELQGLSCA